MPLPHEILVHIHRLEAVVDRGEQKLLRQPDDINTLALIETSRKLLTKYRESFERQAAERKEDVLRYTVYAGRGDVPHVRDIASIFTSFETAVLLTAQAKLLAQPQQRRQLEPPIRAAAFRYGYLFSDREGQLGLVAATNMPAQQLDLVAMEKRGELEPGHPERFKDLTPAVLRESAGEIFDVTRAATKPKIIAEFAKKYGSAVVVELNEWSSLHGKTYLDAEAEWNGGGSSTSLKLSAASPVLDSLHYAIEKLSDDERFDAVVLDGSFYALNTKTRYFSFLTLDEKTKIHGKISQHLLSDKKPMKVPRKYRATFMVRRRFNEALGTDITTYDLKAVEEI